MCQILLTSRLGTRSSRPAAIWIKEPGLGTSVAWHQDGTTHWDHPRWDQGVHGFIHGAVVPDDARERAVWVVPGSHKLGKIDIKARVEAHGSDRLPDAVPVLCGCARGTVSA